jgi:Zn-finger nucleic acid-binding protein
MRPGAVAGLPVEACPSCAGLWLDASSLQALQRRLCQNSAALQRPFVPRPSEPLLSCPACPDGHLQPGTVRSVRAFRCRSCGGVFLPAGELPSAPSDVEQPDLAQPDMGAELAQLLTEILGAFLC